MNVAVLEITSLPTSGLKSLTARQFTSVFPQAIACWAKAAGYDVDYQVYSGTGPLPEFNAPDILFVKTTSQCSVLAYLVAARQPAKTLTVIGGPHAICHPEECLNHFDVVVDGPCNKELILTICRREHTDSVLHSSSPTAIPSVKERWPFIQAAQGRLPFFSVIGMLSSVGCGNGCAFCIDWNARWNALPLKLLEADLQFLKTHTRRPILFQDPNVGRHLDMVLDTMESVGWKNRWAFETDLQSLTPLRLSRLKRTNCVGIGIGIESWTDYGRKVGLSQCTPQQKYARVTEHLEQVKAHIPLITANMMWPNDTDEGDLPVELTKSLIRDHADIWCVLNFPTAYNRTPLHKRLKKENRLLPLPLVFQVNGYISVIPKHYPTNEAIQKFVEFEIASETARKKAKQSLFIKFVSWIYKHGTGSTAQRLLAAMDQKEMKLFHEGRSKVIPQWYWQEYRQLLGPYAKAALALESRTAFTPIENADLIHIPQSAQ
ncbi:MAG: hypothetical protein JXX29_16860 [Deltaproteobacteria bacterium]|nr:hypothetical protein [Deltaproteobacteria bacterium]MBN2673357.1 hypothetical protein [Deltaproteobacteria bacterium]